MSQVTIANPVTVVEVDATRSKVITQTSFGYYGSFVCTLGLDPASTTVAYEVGYNTTIKANGVSIVNDTEITVAHPGVYHLDWHLQFRNQDASSAHDASIWVRKNGADITSSKGVIAVPQRRGQINGHTLGKWAWLAELAAGDNIELMLAVDSTDVDLHVFPAGSSPVSPVSPCTQLWVEQVGY